MYVCTHSSQPALWLAQTAIFASGFPLHSSYFTSHTVPLGDWVGAEVVVVPVEAEVTLVVVVGWPVVVGNAATIAAEEANPKRYLR